MTCAHFQASDVYATDRISCDQTAISVSPAHRVVAKACSNWAAGVLTRRPSASRYRFSGFGIRSRYVLISQHVGCCLLDMLMNLCRPPPFAKAPLRSARPTKKLASRTMYSTRAALPILASVYFRGATTRPVYLHLHRFVLQYLQLLCFHAAVLVFCKSARLDGNQRASLASLL